MILQGIGGCCGCIRGGKRCAYRIDVDDDACGYCSGNSHGIKRGSRRCCGVVEACCAMIDSVGEGGCRFCARSVPETMSTAHTMTMLQITSQSRNGARVERGKRSLPLFFCADAAMASKSTMLLGLQ